jgi:D-glycero-alpha-D-manno-heptose-7-phosphate kinase
MREEVFETFQDSLLLFYTGKTRAGTPILKGQIENMTNRREHYDAMRKLAHDLRRDLEGGQLNGVGACLHENWEHKRELYDAVSDPAIDDIYARALAAGASGGKITGAGGGGFLLIYADRQHRARIERALPGLRQEPFRFEISGSQIVHIGN